MPAVFVLQRNQYSYSTPVARQMANPVLAERIAGGWSIPCETVDGTDAVLTFDAVSAAVERARAGHGPQAVEAVTLRIHGHAAHDDARYVPGELRDAFATRDPSSGSPRACGRTASLRNDLDGLVAAARTEIADGLAEAERSPSPDPATIEHGVWAAPPG